MSERFGNSFNVGSEASAAEFCCACSSSENNALLLTMDTVDAVSVFVAVESIIISITRIISIIMHFSDTNRPYPVPAV